MWALHEEEMDLSTHTSREKAGAFESEKSSSLYFELILTILYFGSKLLVIFKFFHQKFYVNFKS